MAIEKNSPNTEKLTDTLKSIIFREAGAPGKIETAVKKPTCSYFSELKDLLISLNFTYVNKGLGNTLTFSHKNFLVHIFPEAILMEVHKNSAKIFSVSAHKAYVQWHIYGNGINFYGLTPGQLFLALKG